MRSQEGDTQWRSRDTASNKSLVDGTILVTQSWTQKWDTSATQDGTTQDTEREREHELDMITRV